MTNHHKYYLEHHNTGYVAYGDYGRRLVRLVRDIEEKYALMERDTSKYVYYMELITNLEAQFVRWLLEGKHNKCIVKVGPEWKDVYTSETMIVKRKAA